MPRKKLQAADWARATTGARALALAEQRLAQYETLAKKAGAGFAIFDDPDAKTWSVKSGEDGAALVRISGPIDDFFGTDVRAIIARLDELSPTSIALTIESPGGLLTDGMALYSDLRARAKLGVKVKAEAAGLVASAAAHIYLAADERVMGEGALLMIHAPWLFFSAIGSVEEIDGFWAQERRAMLAFEGELRDSVVRRAGVTPAVAAAWLSEEAWFNGKEAVEAGLATAQAQDEEENEGGKKGRSALARTLLHGNIQRHRASLRRGRGEKCR